MSAMGLSQRIIQLQVNHTISQNKSNEINYSNICRVRGVASGVAAAGKVFLCPLMSLNQY